MKETLKRELQEYFKIVEERNEYAGSQIKNLKLFYEIDDDFVNAGIGKIAISFLKETGYNFEKERFDGCQISMGGHSVYVRRYRHHKKDRVYFQSSTDYDTKLICSLLPKGFQEAVEKVTDIIAEYNKAKDEFKTEEEGGYSSYGYRERRKIIIQRELKGSFTIVDDYECRGIENEEVEEVTASSDNDGEDIGLSFGDKQLLYYDEVYNVVVEVIGKLKKMSVEALKEKDEVVNELNNLLNEDNFKALMVSENL